MYAAAASGALPASPATCKTNHYADATVHAELPSWTELAGLALAGVLAPAVVLLPMLAKQTTTA